MKNKKDFKMSVKIGISPIAWQNDDLPKLTKDFTMEQALHEAREIGYTGVERAKISLVSHGKMASP